MGITEPRPGLGDRAAPDRQTDARDDAMFNAATARLIRREALRRDACELNATSAPAIEDALARLSAEMTAEAAYRLQNQPSPAAANPCARPAPAGD
jgi:hypothetical protein